MADENIQDDLMSDYRKWLVAAEQKSQEDFDKTVLSLSGGALGISFIFLKDVIGPQPLVLWGFLLAAWLVWAFSTFSVLSSFYLSHLALRRAIAQVDDGTIHSQQPGGRFARWTAVLNATGVLLFVVGVICITVFAGANLSSKGASNDREEATITATPPDTSSAKAPIITANPGEGQPPPAEGGVHTTTPTTPPASATEK